MSSRYLATVRRVTWMPADCRRAVICSSVSGCAVSSPSIIFFTMRFDDQQRRRGAHRPLHRLREEVAQLENPLWGVGVLVGHRAADGGWMNADLFGDLLDHHRFELVDAAVEKVRLAPHDGTGTRAEWSACAVRCSS